MMPSAADFLPSYIREFMNLASTRSPNLASGVISRRSARWRRDIYISLLRTLGAIERAALLAVLHALGVEHATDDVIANTRKILHAAAADQHDAVFLQVMAFAGDVAQRFEAGGQTHLGDLAQGGVRLLRRRGVDAGADGALLRALLQGRNLVALGLGAARLANELIDCRHSTFPLSRAPCVQGSEKTKNRTQGVFPGPNLRRTEVLTPESRV